MKKTAVLAILLIAISVAAVAQDAVAPALDENLKVLEPFIGSWEGTFSGDGAPPAEVKDIVTYEVVLNGKGIKAEHSVGGAYGGISMYYWDSLTERIRMWYFTNAGAYSEGDVQIKDGKIHFRAYHVGGNTSAWKAVTGIPTESGYQSSAQYYQGGKWVPGHAITYVRK